MYVLRAELCGPAGYSVEHGVALPRHVADISHSLVNMVVVVVYLIRIAGARMALVSHSGAAVV